LLPFTLGSKGGHELKSLSTRQWGLLLLLGLLFYAIVQGTQFFGLAFLPAATVSLILNFTTLVVALMGVFLL